MKLVLVIILTLAAAVGLSVLSLDDPGFVVLNWEPYVIRLPLLMLVVLIIVSFLLLYLLFNFIAGIFRAPKRYGKWREQSCQNAAQKHTMQGFAGLIEGNWSNAEQALLTKLEHNKAPLLNYLGAAYAAQQQGNTQKRNRYLDDALSNNPDQFIAITLTRARLHYQAGEITGARDCLESIRKSAPKNAPAVKLLGEVYENLEDWDSLTKLLSVARRLKLYPEQEIAQREQAAYSAMLSSPALLHGDSNRPVHTWNSLPQSKKKNPAIIASYANQLMKSGDWVQAETILRNALKKSYDPELIDLYGRIESESIETQIDFLSSLKKKHGEDSALLLAFARVYAVDNQIKQSIDHYQKVIESGGSPESFAELGALMERTGELDRAVFFYKKGLGAPNTDSHVANQLDAPEAKGELVTIEAIQSGDPALEPMPVVHSVPSDDGTGNIQPGVAKSKESK